MGSILQPGYLRWDGFKYVLDPTVEIVGPQGPPGPATPGPPGPTGSAGQPAFSTNLTTFVQPVQGSDVGVDVADNTWIAVGSYVILVNGGVYLVQAVGPGTSNLIISNTGVPGNQPSGTTINSGGLVTPSGAPGPTGATGSAGTPATISITYQPGGARNPATLTYTNFSEAFTVRSSIPGYAIMIIDDSFTSPAVIPSSSWSLNKNTSFVGKKGPSVITPGSNPAATGMTQMSFQNSFAIFNDPSSFQNLEIHSSTLAIKALAFTTMNFDMINAVFIADAASTPIISSPGGTINLFGNSYIGDATTGHTVIGDGGSSTASTYINLFDGATIDAQTLAFTGANAPHVVIKSGAASYSSSQPASTASPVVTGTTVSGTPTTGQLITATSANTATWQTPSTGGSTSNFVVAGNNGSIAGGSTGGTTTVMSNVATLTLNVGGTAVLCSVDWTGTADANIFRVIPYMEFSTNGGSSYSQFAVGRASGLPATSGAPSGGQDCAMSITRILSGLTPASTVSVRFGVTVFTTTGSANFNSGTGDEAEACVLTLIEIS
jgi:hypothetical protein